MKNNHNAKSLSTLGSCNYSYQNVNSDYLNTQQSFQTNLVPNDLKQPKKNTLINVLNANDNQTTTDDGNSKIQKYNYILCCGSKQNELSLSAFAIDT